jgi:hypothetical protein
MKLYATSNDETMGQQVNESEHSMSMMLFFAICHFSCQDIVFSDLPRIPPKGFITTIIARMLITMIFSVIVAQGWTQIIVLCVSCLQLPSLDDMAMLFWLLGKPISRILPLLRELLQTLQLLRESTCHASHQIILAAHSTFTEGQISSLSSFDTDSSFWVCDNAATGHICKDKSLFTGDLIPSIYEVGTAAGKSIHTLMGTVTLRVTNDNGVKHSFVLGNVNYLPNLPVNLLSLQ